MMKYVFCLLAAVIGISVAATVPTRADTTIDPVVLKAEGLEKAGKDNDALKLLNAYLAKNPKDARALADVGDAYQDLGDQQKAIDSYTAALALNPDYAYALASRCDS